MSLVRRVFTERRALVVPVLVLLVANVAVLAFIVWPLQNTVAGAKEEQYRIAQDVEAARRDEAQAKANRVSKERADLELRQFYTEILPRDYRSAVGVATFSLGRLAQQSHVIFKSGQWDREAIRDSRLSKVTGQVTLVGEYANIRRFLYEVETAQEFVIIESVELSEANTTQSSSLLELGLSVATYFVSDSRVAGGR